MTRVLVGITTDISETDARIKSDVALAYADRVAIAGGVPFFLPPISTLAREHAAICDALVFTGGDDPNMEQFGVATHPAAKRIHPLRQQYELALFDAAAELAKPVLAICLGMQLMGLRAGAALDQHLPDSTPTHALHKRTEHEVSIAGAKSVAPCSARVWSNHRQALHSSGRLQIVARSTDGLIEAVEDPALPFALGVQWHPERTTDPILGQNLFDILMTHARHMQVSANPRFT